ncbi:MAG TPA: response regulator [Leptolyngbyaceae cyanobacterium M33_DOE_097]|nr:response regulator [Leptolyngbyaceae cyanobacterium M33_DOE_097]
MYRIAIVDDNETWCYTLKAVLQHHSFNVSTFTDAYEFLNVAWQFDLALIDFSMPTRLFKRELDGSQVITQVKERVKNPPFLVLISSYFTKDSLAVAQQICPNADAYLSKSSGLTRIVGLVKDVAANQPKLNASTPSPSERDAQETRHRSNLRT